MDGVFTIKNPEIVQFPPIQLKVIEWDIYIVTGLHYQTIIFNF